MHFNTPSILLQYCICVYVYVYIYIHVCVYKPCISIYICPIFDGMHCQGTLLLRNLPRDGTIDLPPGFLGPKIEVFFAEKNFLVLNAGNEGMGWLLILFFVESGT